jgi:hypothetical protein
MTEVNSKILQKVFHIFQEKTVIIYDILGKIIKKQNGNTTNFEIQLHKNNQVLLLEITLKDGSKIFQKAIH